MKASDIIPDGLMDKLDSSYRSAQIAKLKEFEEALNIGPVAAAHKIQTPYSTYKDWKSGRYKMPGCAWIAIDLWMDINTPKMSNALKVCPFCGSEALHSGHQSFLSFGVSCNDCGGKGPTTGVPDYNDKDESMEAMDARLTSEAESLWNKRQQCE